MWWWGLFSGTCGRIRCQIEASIARLTDDGRGVVGTASGWSWSISLCHAMVREAGVDICQQHGEKVDDMINVKACRMPSSQLCSVLTGGRPITSDMSVQDWGCSPVLCRRGHGSFRNASGSTHGQDEADRDGHAIHTLALVFQDVVQGRHTSTRPRMLDSSDATHSLTRSHSFATMAIRQHSTLWRSRYRAISAWFCPATWRNTESQQTSIQYSTCRKKDDASPFRSEPRLAGIQARAVVRSRRRWRLSVVVFVVSLQSGD